MLVPLNWLPEERLRRHLHHWLWWRDPLSAYHSKSIRNISGLYRYHITRVSRREPHNLHLLLRNFNHLRLKPNPLIWKSHPVIELRSNICGKLSSMESRLKSPFKLFRLFDQKIDFKDLVAYLPPPISMRVLEIHLLSCIFRRILKNSDQKKVEFVQENHIRRRRRSVYLYCDLPECTL